MCACVQLAKYILANAYYRWAASTPYPFIGRSEDDALLHADFLATRYLASLPQPWTSLVLGADLRSSWYQWNRWTLLPTCGAYTLRRWELATAANWTGGGDADHAGMKDLGASHSTTDACSPVHIGPFPHIKGPLAIFSSDVVHTMITSPLFESDERLALAGWDDVMALRRKHLRPMLEQAGLSEDVYYSALLYTLFRARSLTLHALRMSEYAWWLPRHDRRREKPLAPAAVFHQLKTDRDLRSSGLLNESSRLLGKWWHTHGPAMSQSASRQRTCERIATAQRLAKMNCCERWRVCVA